MALFMKMVAILTLVLAFIAVWLGLGMNETPEVETISKEINIQ